MKKEKKKREGEGKNECLSAGSVFLQTPAEKKKFAEDQSDYRSRGGRRVKSGETRQDKGPARDSATKK